MNDTMSSVEVISTGSPQGCVLSPLLFILYTNDCRSTYSNRYFIKLSDDTPLLSLLFNDETGHGHVLHDFVKWCDQSYLCLNVTKTKDMCIDFRRDPPAQTDTVIHDNKVEVVDEYKYLGTTIDNKLRWDRHCTVTYSTADMCNIWPDCAFYDKSMTFGRQVQYTQRKIFRYRDIADLSNGGNGGHFKKDTCFFCDEQDSNDDTLHEASTFELDAHVRKYALQLGDKPLLAKLSAGDLIAQEAKYHTKCLVSLYNKVRDADAKTAEPDPDRMNHAVALAELVTYIEEARTDALVAPVFVLADLAALYTTRMEQLGTIMTERVHSTKLKNRILRYFPDLEEHKQGRDVLLAFNQDLGSALQKACGQDADDDAIHLARAANIVRRDMLKMKTAFSGSFDTYCQEDSVPHTLTGLVGMVLNGSNIRDQPNHQCIPAPTLAISQLLMFNFSARRR